MSTCEASPEDLVSREVTATVSILSEDTTLYAGCGMPIIGRWVYLTRPKPSHRQDYELVAIMHPRCYGVADE